ncbi:MAG: aldehyde dehydrogenase family protein [Planctomycetota bacterium]|nr:aldehyde dehydrogenase family protein [Planctomycetota bacterium]
MALTTADFEHGPAQEVEQALKQAKTAQAEWAGRLVRKRLNLLAGVPQHLSKAKHDLIQAVHRPNATPAEILTSEVFPLADACKFLARRGRQLLAPSSHSWRHAALWMGQIRVRTAREAWGTILVLGPSNYPLFLPGVQALQALAAGNAVVIKPAPQGEKVLQILKQCLVDAEIPGDLLQILPSGVEYGQAAMRLGVDKVVLTGSAKTGQSVLSELSDSLTPTTMELSGCDAVFIADKADVQRAARCTAFALQLNGGATCIAPRRVFVTLENQSLFEEKLLEYLAEDPNGSRSKSELQLPASVVETTRAAALSAIEGGANLLHGELATTTNFPLVLSNVTPQMEVAKSDLFAPVTSILTIADMSEAIEADKHCPYSLGAAVFAPHNHAELLAEQIDAGCVVINDMVVPTGDPRVSFGGRGRSGWGVTRGPEGLREMTRPKVLCSRHGKWLPHLNRNDSQNIDLLSEVMNFVHSSGMKERFRALLQLMKFGRKS